MRSLRRRLGRKSSSSASRRRRSRFRSASTPSCLPSRGKSSRPTRRSGAPGGESLAGYIPGVRMATHYVYDDPRPELSQGDVLQKSSDLLGVIKTFFPYYADHEDYKYFMVL